MLPCVVYRAGQSGGPAPSLDARGCFDQTKSRRTSHYHWITALFLPLSTHNGAPNQPRTRSFHPARRGKIRWPEAFAHFEPWGQPEPSHYAHSIRGASGPDDAATPALSSGLCNLISLLRRVGVESSYSYGSTGLYSRYLLVLASICPCSIFGPLPDLVTDGKPRIRRLLSRLTLPYLSAP